MMNYNDLIKLVIEHPSKSLEALYVSYGKKFYAYCINNWQMSEDEGWEITYKTLETLILKLSNYQFESQRHFDNFLYKVLINFLRQHFRKNRGSEVNELQFVDLTGIDLPYTIYEKISSDSFNEYYKSEIIDSPALLSLNKALAQMSIEERDLLLLKAQNYTYDEIANMLNIANSSLKVKHHRAKKKLTDMLIETKSHDHG
jgi:RNA polymerase sigma factor (sigma-70 family)